MCDCKNDVLLGPFPYSETADDEPQASRFISIHFQRKLLHFQFLRFYIFLFEIFMANFYSPLQFNDIDILFFYLFKYLKHTVILHLIVPLFKGLLYIFLFLLICPVFPPPPHVFKETSWSQCCIAFFQRSTFASATCLGYYLSRTNINSATYFVFVG